MKNNYFIVRMKDEEREILRKKAESLNTTQSAFIKEVILNLDYIENKELFEEFLTTNKLLLENLHRIGSNLNQIAHALNMDITQSNSEILAVFQSLQELLKEYKSFMMSSKYPKLLKKRKFGNE